MANLIEIILKDSVGMLSSELSKILVETHGLSRVAARQRITRRSDAIGSLDIPFPRNARFLYYKRYFGSDDYWEKLTKAFMANHTAYGLALSCLRQRGGILPTDHFTIACGAPLMQAKHLSPDTIYNRLRNAGLIETYQIGGVGPCIAFRRTDGYWDSVGPNIRARLIAEKILLDGMKDWARNLGLVSFEKVQIRQEGKLPRVGTFAWDMSAPSYVSPLVQWDKDNNPKSGFIACDVILGSQMSSEGIKPFINKCTTLRSLVKVGRTMNILVAEHYSKEALVLAKRWGILPATPESLFGKDVAEGLIAVMQVITRAAEYAVRPEIFEEVFERLGRFEGAMANLRGAFFEYLVANLIRKNADLVELNRIIRTDKGEVEIDIVAWKPDVSVRFIECKGNAPYALIPDEEIEDWLQKTIPITFQYARTIHPDWRNIKLHFEFWTTAKISEKAKALLEKASEINSNRYTVKFIEPNALKAEFRSSGDKGLMNVIERFYFENPFISAERAVRSRPRISSSITDFIETEDNETPSESDNTLEKLIRNNTKLPGIPLLPEAEG